MYSEHPVHALAQAVAVNVSYDAFAPAFTPTQWETVGNYLQSFEVSPGEILIDQGGLDRTLFFIESGSLSVHLLDAKGQMRLAILGAGSVVGEGAFFSRAPRSANVVATVACRLWRLTAVRFSEMANRQPDLALEIALALGAVLSKRMVSRLKRVAVT